MALLSGWKSLLPVLVVAGAVGVALVLVSLRRHRGWLPSTPVPSLSRPRRVLIRIAAVWPPRRVAG